MRGVVASLLLTAAPTFAAKASTSTSQVQQRTHSASRPAAAKLRDTSPQRHAALHRRGRAYARAATNGNDADADSEYADTRHNGNTAATAENPAEGAVAEGAVIARGTASWYGVKGNGLRTSSGETFDENAMTAAHPWLPLGTRVRVTVAATGTSIIVTINDRQGTRARVIDLSKGAARELGILGRGIATVTLTRA